jgi:hypothetical protein
LNPFEEFLLSAGYGEFAHGRAKVYRSF